MLGRSQQNGQLPILEIDGEQIAQSIALMGYAAKLAGIHPIGLLSSSRQISHGQIPWRL